MHKTFSGNNAAAYEAASGKVFLCILCFMINRRAHGKCEREGNMPQKSRERNIAIVLSAGRGSRMHTGQPKQYLELCGRPVIAWPLQAFEEFDGIDDVILVSAEEDIEYCRNDIVNRYGFSKVRSVVAGGAERYLSVWQGLKEAARILYESAVSGEKNGIVHHADSQSGSDADDTSERGAGEQPQGYESYIMIHDGARPLVDGEILGRALNDVREHGACVVGMPVKDTIKMADDDGFAADTPPRSRLWQIQTPQTFSFPLVYEAYRRLIEDGVTDVTDDAMVVERRRRTKVKLTVGSYRNLKITTPEDLEIARMLMQR